MRKFNKSLNTDINELKRLHMLKDKTKFKKRKLEVMAKHKISRATVYREMKKDNPGYYKSPQFNPPIRQITAKEKELVQGMLYRQMPIERIRTEMESRLGESYSWDRIDMIRQETENHSTEHEAGSSGRGSSEPHEMKKSIKYEYTSPNGDDMRIFIETIMGIKDMKPGTFIKIKHKGYELKVGADAVNDIQRIASNSAASGGMNILETEKINNKHLCAEQIRLFSQGKVHSIKDLMMIDRILKDYESEGREGGADFDFVVRTVQNFDPDATREDIIVYLSFNPPREGSVDKALLPDEDERQETIEKWTEEHI